MFNLRTCCKDTIFCIAIQIFQPLKFNILYYEYKKYDIKPFY